MAMPSPVRQSGGEGDRHAGEGEALEGIAPLSPSQNAARNPPVTRAHAANV